MKQQVEAFWAEHICETDVPNSPVHTAPYYEELDAYRYTVTPSILDFVQFDKWRDKKILEIGVGAGTDFIQFVKAGADAYGIDLTNEAVEHTKKRLQHYGLKGNVEVGDAEKLKYQDETFDLVYSFGVLHHTPDTVKAISEAVRVTKKHGVIKMMLYNRHSLMSLWVYLRSLAVNKKISSLSWAWAHGKESAGTKAYTIKEVSNIFDKYSMENIAITNEANEYDYLFKYNKAIQWLASMLISIIGRKRAGYFMLITAQKA